jgi:hypothetical protein
MRPRWRAFHLNKRIKPRKPLAGLCFPQPFEALSEWAMRPELRVSPSGMALDWRYNAFKLLF